MTLKKVTYIIFMASLLGALWGLSPWHPARAQTTPGAGPWKNKPVMCNKAHIVVEIMKNSGENPIVWMDGEVFMPSGQRPRSKFVIALNPEKESWTLIEFMNLITEGEKAGAYQDACILGVGQGKINFTLTTRKGIDL